MKPKYIVLDRDGVINVDLFDYVMDTKDFKFEDDSYEALIELGKNGYEIIVATNQKCINLGLISFEGIENCNDFSIGVELEGTDHDAFTDSQYAALTQLTRDLLDRLQVWILVLIYEHRLPLYLHVSQGCIPKPLLKFLLY